MYKIINNTQRKTFIYFGAPPRKLDEMIENGDDLIVISTYSNTIKVPTIRPKNDIIPELLDQYSDKCRPNWDFDEYKFDLYDEVPLYPELPHTYSKYFAD